jgi:FAD/FMN-containing dehydrogenase
MDTFDRRDLVARAGRLALAASLLGAEGGRAALGAPPAGRLRELQRALEGDVVARGSAAYARARLLVNTRFDAIKPQAIVLAETVADVQRTIGWARKHGVRVVPRSGGHSYGGYSTGSGVVVDVSRLRAVKVDAARRTASIGAGARLIDVYARLWEHGLTIPAGSCASVGIAGLALGGGVGFASRKHGLTCDQLLGLTLVTAAGRRLASDATHHPDLFWACRGGGGGNFGIATSFRFRLHRVGGVTTYRIDWPAADARAVVRAWQDWAPDAPDELFSVLRLSAGGVSSSGQLLGPEATLRSLLQPLLAAGSPTRVTLTPRGYFDAVQMWAGCSHDLEECAAKPRETFTAKSDYALRPLSSRGIDTLVRVATTAPPGSSILLDSYGGAIERVPRTATAFAHRRARFSFQYLAYWSPAASGAAQRAWIKRAHAAMRPHVSGFAYVNYIDPELRDWATAYYGSNYPRLQRVKRAYDPGNFFRFALSIRPA